MATFKLCSCSLSCDSRNWPIRRDCSHDLPIVKVSCIVLSCYGYCPCKCEGKYLRLMTQGRKNFPTEAAIKSECLAHDRHTQIALDQYTAKVTIFQLDPRWRQQISAINLRTTSAKFWVKNERWAKFCSASITEQRNIYKHFIPIISLVNDVQSNVIMFPRRKNLSWRKWDGQGLMTAWMSWKLLFSKHWIKMWVTNL